MYTYMYIYICTYTHIGLAPLPSAQLTLHVLQYSFFHFKLHSKSSIFCLS